MIQRPKNTDTMEDVMKMQEEFIKSKEKEKDFKSAAEVKKVYKNEPKQSEFSKRRNLKKDSSSSEKKMKTEELVMGDVVERKYDGSQNKMDVDESTAVSDDRGFPKPKPIDVRSCMAGTTQNKSIFSQMMDSKNIAGSSKAPLKSTILSNQERDDIHKQNSETINQMSESEILEEQEKLMKTLDPKLIEFLKSKKSEKPAMDTVKKEANSRELPKIDENLPDLNFLNNETSKNWLHFDIFEPEKLEWTRDIEKTFSNLKEGEAFEARFDWKGFLLPYIEKESDKDDRELYLHGEEANRPGYTLQELFRLARSNVLQQRVSALNAIAGIINIYNQGYYDDILELPISKIFFLLRFALDENKPAIIEAASKGISYLFYNDTDETLLDIACETSNGIYQPCFDSIITTKSETFEGLDSSLENLYLDEKKSKLFESNLNDLADGMGEKESLDDFYLAEVNLMECLVRTNIIERISYIFTVMEPNEPTILSCVKILIRISRNNQEFAMKILNKNNLMNFIVKKYSMTSMDFDTSPHFIVLKLLRILISYDISFCIKLKNAGMVEMVKEFLETKRDINVNLLKLQIEASRFLRVYFKTVPDESLFYELMSPIRYLLEWHYQFLSYEKENHFIIRQHASSLLYLLSCGNFVVLYPLFSEIFNMCLCKWFTIAGKSGSNEFSQKLLLSSLLDVAAKFISFAPEFFFDFIENYLMKFLSSSVYLKMSESACTSSPFFKQAKDRSSIYKPLPNLGAIIRFNKIPTLILNQDYSIHFMLSLLNFIENLNNMSNIKNQEFHQKLKILFFNEEISKYLDTYSLHYNRNLRYNWFLKTEVNFIFNLIDCKQDVADNGTLKIAFNLLNCLSQENVDLIFKIFDKFVFNQKFYRLNKKSLMDEFDNWKFIYNGIVVSKLKNINVKKSFAVRNWSVSVLEESWPYSLLLILLYNIETSTEERKIVETELSEEQLIITALQFTNLLEFNKVNLVTTNQKLMYLICTYFGKNLNFLDEPVKQLITEKLEKMKGVTFNFNAKLNNERSFEALYKILLDVFQSSSYGDSLFGAILMIPLAQKYDIKWKNLVWAEYVTSMKFVNCQEDELLDDITEYLSPEERDATLLQIYSSAINSNLLRPESVPYKIALHHVNYRKNHQLTKHPKKPE